jgi:hypothetical protein
MIALIGRSAALLADFHQCNADVIQYPEDCYLFTQIAFHNFLRGTPIYIYTKY